MKVTGSKVPMSFSLVLCVSFSALGLTLLPFLLAQSASLGVNLPNSSFLIGFLYSLVCVLGIVAVFYPEKCQKSFTFRKGAFQGEAQTAERSGITLNGHHPSCKTFDGNRIKIREFVFCSACAGLFTGAVFVLIGTFLYFFFGMPFPLASSWVLLIGIIAMVLGLVQFVFRNYEKFFVNGLFVVGTFLILISADSLGRNLLIDLYVLGLIVFLLLTRILLSEWNNQKLCFECGSCAKWGLGVFDDRILRLRE